ncbi:MAG TPA: 30S ribosomal protein S27ae [Thermoplasmata archaeon]|nr:30S ribosomal protein S27ae [Thermoplasmata archaeon]
MTSTQKWTFYKLGDGVERLKKECPKCGPGVFLAEHPDRLSCGACGYTEFRKK